MHQRPRRAKIQAAVAMSGVAIGLAMAPDWIGERVKSTAIDSSRPGQVAAQKMVDTANETVRTWGLPADKPARDPAISDEIEALRLRNRRLQIANTMLREELETLTQTGVSPYRSSAAEPLFETELISAAIVGRETASRWQAGHFIDKGTDAEIVERALVLDSGNLLIDQGHGSAVDVEQPVYCGRCVVGRISETGRWMSTVQSLTDPGYRSELVQLVRQTSHGTLLGAKGILEGQGKPLCKLREIESTESVRVGDEVYTGQRDAQLPFPMYYGRVVKAELNPGARHWEVWVQPAVEIERLKSVQVLKTQLNPLRAAAE